MDNRAHFLRLAHTERIVGLLRQGPVSRAELQARTGLSRATVSAIVAELRRDGVVAARPDPHERTGPGRPAELIGLADRNARTVGVAFYRDGLRVALGDALHQIVGVAERPFARSTGWAERGAVAVETLRELCVEYEVTLAGVDGVGVGVVGPVAPGRLAGRWRVAVDRLAEAVGAPVYVDNNVRLAALAETIWGAAAGHDSALYLHVGEGVGGGLVLGGRLYRGDSGAAGEFGHVTVDPDGPRCHCSRRGCLELYANVPAILSAAGRRGARARDIEAGYGLAEALADPAVDAALRRAAEHAGTVVAAALATVDVHHVVVGGLFAAAGEHVRRTFADTVRSRVLASVAERLRVVPAALGAPGGALGAVALVHHSSPLLTGYEPLRHSITERRTT
ncbi:ROK family transcriptional regulator [Actinocatenispora rupis]|uniref:Transcriptional regulator n=1 Tax=Actinocatenispora rupis TaxID=519421 RepID=A0A8J3JE77_9ACTN|nr:ROK family transcriptional regulator [Actinocatenispora rupis]GID15084.1 transcriptional regulator [Actinocatenispora rupis]